MIRLQRSRTASTLPKDFTGQRLRAKLEKLVTARIAKGDKIKFEGAIGDWKKAKEALKRDTFDKCAYCESDTAKVAHGDVEHFRPKSVYWWLALCLDNYVYACQLCNQTYKSDNFPVHGKVQRGPTLPSHLPTTPQALDALIAKISPDPASVDDVTLLSVWFRDKAHLPHPYLQDPEPLFAWKVSKVNGEVHIAEPNNASAQARRAVAAVTQYLGLNRETLTRSRYLIYSMLEFALSAWNSGSGQLRVDATNLIQEMCKSRYQYAGMSRYFARAAGFPT